MIVPVFNQKIAVYKYDKIDSFTGKNKLKKSVDSFFNLPALKESSSIETYGDFKTSLNMWNQYPVFETFNLNEYELGIWLKEHIIKGAKELGLDKYLDVYSYKLMRSWSNRMYSESQNAAHIHGNGCDMVCIFYYEAPSNSGELIFLNEDIELYNNKTFDKYLKENRFHFKPETGHFVCHLPNIPHSVSYHKSKHPRTVFVFEPKFKLKSF